MHVIPPMSLRPHAPRVQHAAPQSYLKETALRRVVRMKLQSLGKAGPPDRQVTQIGDGWGILWLRFWVSPLQIVGGLDSLCE